MDRRTVLAAGGTGLAALAGCMGGRLNFSGEPTISWDWSSEGFVGQGLQPTVWVYGDVTNTSDVFIEEVAVHCTVVDGSDQEIMSSRRILESLAAGEEQLFHFRFDLGSAQVDQYDDVEVSFLINGEEPRS